MEKENKNTQYSILKINMSNLKNNNGTYDLDVTTKFFRKLKTLGKESELFRIVNHLRSHYKINGIEIEDDIDNNKDYPLIQDLVSIYINKKTYYENSDGTVRINYIDYEDEENKNKKETMITYKRLLASSSHVRNQKIIYINEKLYNDAVTILLCGMPEDMRFEIMAKFNSYFGLCSTDGIPVKMPNILVIPDYKHEIEEEFDVVEEYEQDKYKVVPPGGKREHEMKPHDGAALIDVRRVIQWCRNKDELDLKYIPSSLLIRLLPGIKGNIYTVDLKKYILEKGIIKRKDAWGTERDLIDKDGNLIFDCILTESMVKFREKYNSYEEWFKSFNTEVEGYKRTFNICQWSDNPKKLKHKVPLSYQVLQSLELSDTQIEILCEKTIKTITEISTDVDKFIKYRGINIEDKDKRKMLPEYYRALALNKSLFYDPWIQKKIQQDIDGFKKRAYLGGVLCQGNYQVLGIDVVSLLEWSLDLPVKGILKRNEIYSNYWDKKGVNEVGLVRFPHVSHEWAIRNVVKPEIPDVKYMKYQRATICVSIHDSTDLRLGGADHDNDHAVSLSDRVLIMAAKNNGNQNTVLPDKTYDNEDKKKNRKRKISRINDIKQLIKTDCNAMRNSIGAYVNDITKLWSLKQTEEIRNYIKIMSVICSKVIDFAKTGIPAKVPDDIKEILEANNQLPYFMQYRYPKKVVEQNKINSNLALMGEKSISMFSDSNCTMNRICHYLEGKIKVIKLEPKEVIFDFNKFYKKRPDKYHNTYYESVLNKLGFLKKEHDTYADGNDFLSKDERIENANQYKLFYNYCKNSLLAICPDVDKLIDILIFIFYEDKKFYVHNPDKAILFNCFGTRLRNRLEDKARDIPIENIENYIIEKKQASKKANKKLTKKREVNFALYQGGRFIDIVNDPDRGLTDSEIKYIKDNAVNSDARRLLYYLILLDKSCTKHNSDFRIFHGVKNKSKITKTAISDLARINDKQYKKYMGIFGEKGIINLSFKDNKQTYLICKVNSPNEGTTELTINNLNESHKYFKNIS